MAYADLECGCVLGNNTGTEELYFASPPVLLSMLRYNRRNYQNKTKQNGLLPLCFQPKGCRKHFSLVMASPVHLKVCQDNRKDQKGCCMFKISTCNVWYYVVL